MKQFLLLMITSVTLFSCTSLGSNTSKAPFSGEPTDVTVRLKWFHGSQFSGMYVADKNGFYIDNGIAPYFLELDRSVSPIEDVSSGNSDFALVNSSDLLLAVNKGIPVKAIAVIYKITPTAFMSLSAKGINNPEDIKGKRIGIPGGRDVGYANTKAFLKSEHIDPDDVYLVDSTFDQINDLITDKIDLALVYRTNQAVEAKNQGLKYSLMFPEFYQNRSYDDVLITSEKHIKNNPELVKAFVKATLQGWDQTVQNPAQAISYIPLYNENADLEKEAESLELSLPLIYSSDSTLGKMEEQDWHFMAQALSDSNLISKDLDLDTVYTNEFIPTTLR